MHEQLSEVDTEDQANHQVKHTTPTSIPCILTLLNTVLPQPATPDLSTLPPTGSVVSFRGFTRGDALVQIDEPSAIVLGLEYSCYLKMAMKQLIAICDDLPPPPTSSARVTRVEISHTINCLVPLHSPSFEVVVCSAHRSEGLAALEWLLTEVKARVPIWKKEIYGDSAITKWCVNKEWDKGRVK